MFSHVFVSVSDFERALRFYQPLMQGLELELRFCEPGRPWAGWHSAGRSRPFFVIGKPHDGLPHAPGNGQMVAFAAADRAMVRTVHGIALAHGGSCEGAPGLRTRYQPNYYGAYFRDPDGNKFGVACHAPQVEASAGIRIATYADTKHREQVVRLWGSTFSYGTAHNDPALGIDKKLAVADGLFFVALAQGAVVGTVLAGYDGHRGWLYSVAVDPGHRSRGVGTALVAHAERALTDRGCMKINLQIVPGNESVAAFYEALGYAVEPRVSMGKRIVTNIPGGVPPQV